MADLPVEWSAPETCATATEMVAAVHERLGDASVELKDLVVRGRAEREGSGWVAILVLRDAEGTTMGERRVHETTSDCRALDGSVSLVVAMMLRQHLTKADFFVPPPPVPARVERSKPQPPPPPPPLHIAWTAAASACVSVGIMPAPGFGATARIDNRFGDVVGFALEVGGEGASDVRPFAGSAGAVSFSMFEAAARLDFAAVHATWIELRPAAIARAGVVWARGQNFDAYNRTDVSPMATLGAGALVSVRIVSGLRLELAAEAAFPLVHDAFQTVHGSDMITLQNSPIAAHFEGGLAWRLD